MDNFMEAISFINPIIPSVLFACILILLFRVNQKFSNKQETKSKKSKKSKKPNELETNSKQAPKKSAALKKKKPSLNKPFTHPWLHAVLKGHTERILNMDLASNEIYLASCSEDRTVFIWDVKDLTGKNRRSCRVNIDFDYATHIKWSPDNKAFLIQKSQSNCMEVFKIEKKKDGWLTATKASTFDKVHEADVIGIGIANTGKYIMSCSNKTDMIIWTLKGEKLARVDTFLMTTTCAKVSPCGRFVVASGFTPEAKVWEIIFNKTGDFKEVKAVPELTLGGHSSGVYDVAFDSNCTRLATVSKDGTWKLFDINVNYKQGQNAKLLLTADYVPGGSNALIALSPNGHVVVIATGNELRFYSTLDSELDCIIEDISDEGSITSILFDPSGKYLFASVENQIKIFHNVTGYRCNIAAAKMDLGKSHQTSANKERLNKIIADSEAFLAEIGKN